MYSELLSVGLGHSIAKFLISPSSSVRLSFYYVKDLAGQTWENKYTPPPALTNLDALVSFESLACNLTTAKLLALPALSFQSQPLPPLEQSLAHRREWVSVQYKGQMQPFIYSLSPWLLPHPILERTLVSRGSHPQPRTGNSFRAVARNPLSQKKISSKHLYAV